MYVTQAQIETAIPAQHLRDALDDNGDGLPDTGVLEAIITSAGQAADAFLAGLFSVPFADPAPAAVAEAAFCFACERIYDRRQIFGKNPWTERAGFWRGRLAEIGSGKMPLDATLEKSFAPGAAVTEPARIDGTMT
jgi:hypothetical protein